MLNYLSLHSQIVCSSPMISEFSVIQSLYKELLADMHCSGASLMKYASFGAGFVTGCLAGPSASMM